MLNVTEEGYRLHPGTVARFVFNRRGRSTSARSASEWVCYPC